MLLVLLGTVLCRGCLVATSALLERQWPSQAAVSWFSRLWLRIRRVVEPYICAVSAMRVTAVVVRWRWRSDLQIIRGRSKLGWRRRRRGAIRWGAAWSAVVKIHLLVVPTLKRRGSNCGDCHRFRLVWMEHSRSGVVRGRCVGRWSSQR